MAVALVLIVAMGGGLIFWLTPQVLARVDEWLAIHRMRHTRPVALEDKDPMPSDLAALALAYPEEWAREDTMKRLQELYEESRDWDRVRQVATSLRMGET